MRARSRMILVGFVASFWFLLYAEGNRGEEEVPVALYRAMMGAENDSTLGELLERCQKLSAEQQEVILGKCLTGMGDGSDERLPFHNRSAEQGHDLSLVRGRCAWIAGRTLGVDLPPVTRKTPRKDVSKVRLTITKAIEEKRRESVTLLMSQFPRMPLSHRRKLAESNASKATVLEALSHDSSADVRQAVATNRNTHLSVVSKLASGDENASVRKAARENLETIRTFRFPTDR